MEDRDVGAPGARGAQVALRPHARGDVAERRTGVHEPRRAASFGVPSTAYRRPRSAARSTRAARRPRAAAPRSPRRSPSPRRSLAPSARADSAADGSARTRPTASASASGSAGGTSSTFSPSRSASGSQRPRVRVRTTGRPQADACSVTLWPDGCGTSFTGTTTTAAERNASRTSASLSSRRCQSAGSQRTFVGQRGGAG